MVLANSRRRTTWLVMCRCLCVGAATAVNHTVRHDCRPTRIPSSPAIAAADYSQPQTHDITHWQFKMLPASSLLECCISIIRARTKRYQRQAIHAPLTWELEHSAQVKHIMAAETACVAALCTCLQVPKVTAVTKSRPQLVGPITEQRTAEHLCSAAKVRHDQLHPQVLGCMGQEGAASEVADAQLRPPTGLLACTASTCHPANMCTAA
jgi:hypothetical protein